MPTLTLETDSEIVLLALRPLLMPVYESLELAVPKAIQIVVENGWESSGHLTSHLIRAEAKKFLKDRPCPIRAPLQSSQDALPSFFLTRFDGWLYVCIRNRGYSPHHFSK